MRNGLKSDVPFFRRLKVEKMAYFSCVRRPQDPVKNRRVDRPDQALTGLNRTTFNAEHAKIAEHLLG
jgi:hypothetical protein